jgi:two-component system sensor histidine kinase/response regulator
MNVLVVEDRPLTAYILKEYLASQRGWGATQVGDGERALEMLRLNQFDAVILDYCLPGRDGLSLAQEIRADRTIKGGAVMPIVLVTGLGAEMIAVLRERLANYGSTTVFQKPVDPQALLDELTRLRPKEDRYLGERG